MRDLESAEARKARKGPPTFWYVMRPDQGVKE
jgi:hypothetical protein